jgi:predicted SnoaL-like aldol condensation-catalyzing enzyme
MKQQQKHRPLGVTIMVILTIIDGIAFLASGIAAVTLAPFSIYRIQNGKMVETWNVVEGWPLKIQEKTGEV